MHPTKTVKSLHAEWNGQSPDENNDEIALAELKFSKDGNYIPNSLSISPLAWAMKKISSGIKNASEKLSVFQYFLFLLNIQKQIVFHWHF